VDEAYHEFSGRSVVPLLREFDNLVVLRTFSKAMGLAGLRVGYLLASPALAREVNKARLPYNLNFFSQAAALLALHEQAHLRANVLRLRRERERLAVELAALPGCGRIPRRPTSSSSSWSGPPASRLRGPARPRRAGARRVVLPAPGALPARERGQRARERPVPGGPGRGPGRGAREE